MNLSGSEFVKSAAEPSGFIRDLRPQLVFAGRSNAGKSSVINRLLGRKNLARVGSAPGKTAHINYYLAGGALYFVDLPGYGYARVSREERERWGRLMEAYFSGGGRIAAGLLVVDARRVPGGDDAMMARWFLGSGLPLAVVANKTDKLKRSELEGGLKAIEEALAPCGAAAVLPFSALTGEGRDALWAFIEGCALRGAPGEEGGG